MSKPAVAVTLTTNQAQQILNALTEAKQVAAEVGLSDDFAEQMDKAAKVLIDSQL